MAYPTEVKEYAKELFLTVGKDGSHKYSSREISKELSKKFPDLKKFPSHKTIQDWANGKENGRKTWNDIWDEGQRHGVDEAIAELESEQTSDEKIGLQVDAITRARANRAIKLGELVDSKIKNKIPLENIDLKTLQTSELIFNNLNLEVPKEIKIEVNERTKKIEDVFRDAERGNDIK
jgi:HD superfamily phosphohydrolase